MKCIFDKDNAHFKMKHTNRARYMTFVAYIKIPMMKYYIDLKTGLKKLDRSGKLRNHLADDKTALHDIDCNVIFRDTVRMS